MCRWPGVLRLAGALAVALGVAASSAHGQEPAPAPALSPEREMSEGQKARYKDPIPFPGSLFLDIDRYDRRVLGPELGREGIVDYLDWDLLTILAGYRNETREAREGEPAGEYGYAYAFPLYWSAWDPASSVFFFPLGGLTKRGRDWRGYFFPAMSTVGAGPDHWDVSVVWPLLAVGADRDAAWARVAPIFWYEAGSKGSHLGLLPAFWYQTWAETGEARLWSPLAYHASDRRTSYTAVTPFIHRWRNLETGSGVDLGPLYVDAFTRAWRFQALAPLAARWRGEGQGELWTVGPAWHWASARHPETAWGVFPLAWRFRDEARQTASFTVLPLYHERSDGKAGTTTRFLLPLFSYNDSQASTLLWIAPLNVHAEDKATGATTTVAFPLLFRHADGKGTTTMLLGPWFAHDDPERTVRYLFPLGGYARSGTRTRTHVCFPVFSMEHDEQAGLTGLDFLFPLVSYRQEGARARWRALPLAFGDSDAGGRRAVVLPLVFHRREGNDAQTLVLPFHGHSRKGDQEHTLWPLYWRSESPAHCHEVLFPLWWDLEDRKDKSRTQLLFPLMAHRREANGDWWTSALGPLFLTGGNANDGRSFVDVVAPLFHYEQTRDRYHWRLLPVAFGDGAKDRARTVALPLFWHASDAEGAQTILFPLFGSYRRGARSHALGPCYWWHDNGRGATQEVIFPLYWDLRSPQGRSQHLWPFYGSDTWLDDAGKVRYERTWVLFPLFRAYRDHEAGRAGWDAPWPLVGAESGPDSQTTHALPLFAYWRRGKAWTALAFPLFYADGDGTRTRAICFPLAAYWADETTGSALGLAPFAHYWREGPQSSWSLLFPVFYGTRTGTDRWSFRFLWEVFAVERTAPNAIEWRVLGGQLFQYKHIGDEQVIALNPLFRYEVKGDRYTYFSFLLGLFYSYERDGDRYWHRTCFGLIPVWSGTIADRPSIAA